MFRISGVCASFFCHPFLILLFLRGLYFFRIRDSFMREKKERERKNWKIKSFWLYSTISIMQSWGTSAIIFLFIQFFFVFLSFIDDFTTLYRFRIFIRTFMIVIIILMMIISTIVPLYYLSFLFLNGRYIIVNCVSCLCLACSVLYYSVNLNVSVVIITEFNGNPYWSSH